MLAAVTQARARMSLVEAPEPDAPGPGEVIVRLEAVGLCGSDFHYFTGDLGAVPESRLYPRIQGHEAAGKIEEVGSHCPGLLAGDRVAIWPVTACGSCYPCSLGRGNACANIALIGIHHDGALQERLRLPATQVFPVGDQDAVVSALVEPVSIAVRAVVRGRVAAGEKVVVFGAGPIGQALAVASIDRGASVLLLDPVATRLERARATGADGVVLVEGVDAAAAAREWAGGDGPEVVFEATGVPEVATVAVDLVAPAGRVVVVGLGMREAPLRAGTLAFKELDLLGTSCCGADEFEAAVSLVARHREALAGLVTHEFPLASAPEAIVYAMEHQSEVTKAVIRLDA